MDLKEYVRRSVLEITDAVAEAQLKAKLAIAPGYIDGERRIDAQMIEFEIAVTTNKEAGGGISVLSAAEAKGKLKMEHVNKISFSVPVYFQSENPRNEK